MTKAKRKRVTKKVSAPVVSQSNDEDVWAEPFFDEASQPDESSESASFDDEFERRVQEEVDRRLATHTASERDLELRRKERDRSEAWEKKERERNYERARQEDLSNPLEQARLAQERSDRFGW